MIITSVKLYTFILGVVALIHENLRKKNEDSCDCFPILNASPLSICSLGICSQHLTVMTQTPGHNQENE